LGQIGPCHAASAMLGAPALGRFLRNLGVAPSDVEDALQDVFIVAHRRLNETPEAADAMGPWLRGVAVNVARNRARSSYRSRVDFVDEAPEIIDARTPESEVAAERDRRRLLRLLATLHEAHREALVLFEIEGRPMKEVASTLGCALPTAYKYVTQAQAKLREAWTSSRARCCRGSTLGHGARRQSPKRAQSARPWVLTPRKGASFAQVYVPSIGTRSSVLVRPASRRQRESRSAEALAGL